MSFLKSASRYLPVVMLVPLLGCSGWDAEIVNPSRPASVRGWEQYGTGSITVKGEFVLSKGESIDNGRVGIKVVDIYPAKYHIFDSPELPKAKMEFFRVSDKSRICEEVFTRGGNRLDLPHVCKNDLEWIVIYIRDINHDEGWVFFDLR